MDILTNKYISSDEINEIASRIPPNSIISFCRVNKLSNTICASKTFWNTYINDNQEKYHKLLYNLAKSGSLKLFKRLWGNGDLRPKNIISEPNSLIIWKTAFKNGHKYMAKYIYTLYAIWYEKFDSPNDITAELFQEYIEKTYSAWDEVNIFLSNGRFKNQFKIESFKVLLGIAISQEDYDYIVAILEDPPTKTRYLLSEFGEIRSISLFNKLLKFVQDQGYDVSNKSLNNILSRAVSSSNFKLAEYMLKKYPDLRNSYVLIFAFHSYSADAIKFIEKYIPTIGIETYSGAIMNRDVLDYMLNRASEHTFNNIILGSYRAFYPYEYTNLVTETMGCIDKSDQTHFITQLLRSGDYYTAKVLIEEVAVCAPGLS